MVITQLNMTSPQSPSAEKRFADYFVICGLDLSSGLEPDQLSGDSLHCTPLDRPYRSKVIAHYPENVPWNPFDKDAVGMLCLPRGLSFCTQKHPREPKHHTFIITKEDGSKTYGHALVYYEEVSDKQICAAMQTLQAMHLTELSSSGSKGQSLHNIVDTGGTRSLPRSFKLTTQQPENSVASLYDITKDTLYVTKCICLITQFSMIVACKKFLQGLYNAIASPDPPPLPLESYVYNILYEVPLPIPGRSVMFSCFGQNIVCQRPGPGELPLFEYSYQEFFTALGVENALLLYTSVLLENQILLLSEDYYKLMLVAECITMLLFPFTWQHVYVPILPASLHHFLDAPVPYIMGLHRRPCDRSQVPEPGEANLCFVDIDNKMVELPEDIPKLPYKADLIADLSPILAKYGVSISQEGTEGNLNQRMPRRHVRKYSWDADSGECHFGISNHRILQQSKAVQSVMDIAMRTGVITSLEDLSRPRRGETNHHLSSKKTTDGQQYLNDLKLNHAIREIFLKYFINMFSSYEHFVIQPSQQTVEQLLSSRETMQNFDKIAFLSDQPEPYLPFLSRFIETQMFATLIDNKIGSQWEDMDPYLKLFDSRINALNAATTTGEAVGRPHCYKPYSLYPDADAAVIGRSTFYKPLHTEAEERIEKRLTIPDVTAPAPQINDRPVEQFHAIRRKHVPGNLPMLDSAFLNQEPNYSRSRRKTNSQWKRRERQLQHAEHLQLNSEQREHENDIARKHAERWQKYIQEARNKSMNNTKLSDTSVAALGTSNWKFVEASLKECKMRTKRMLVEKMGQEAIELGHNEVSITGLEENTLIASLCDLLERVWNHGLLCKQGKSALWSHLLRYLEVEECKTTGKPIDPNFLTPVPVTAHPQSNWTFNFPELILSFKNGSFASTLAAQLANFDISTLALEKDPVVNRRERQEKKKTTLKPLPVSLIYDVKNIQTMTEIKTDIGYARAWVRLSLERKLLSRHMKKLLSNQELLKGLYKRYAFLRCEEEREQFLYHLLTLNAVDYHCFTNTFTSTIIPYRVVIFPSRKISASLTSANAWIQVSGTLGETGIIDVPRQMLEIVFHHKNLGLLTTLRIGHDNSGLSPRWMVENVLVRNEITGYTYKFPCGRWLGKGVDDGSTERLLVGELLPPDIDTEELLETCRTPPRCRSPSMPRRPSEPKLTVPEIQQILGDAVNNIVKYYYKPEKERGSLTILLCGELGLVYCLEQVFLYGFKATRFFRHVYLWDFFVKVKSYFETVLQEDVPNRLPISQDLHEHVIVMRTYCQLIDKIDKSSHSMGKDGKFQLFICFAARDHLLHRMLLHIASTPVTSSMYDEQSFLRDPNLVTFLVQILESLSEFNMVLEASLTKGIES